MPDHIWFIAALALWLAVAAVNPALAIGALIGAAVTVVVISLTLY